MVAPKLVDSILEAPVNAEDNVDDDENEDEEDSEDDDGEKTPAEGDEVDDKSKRNEDLKPLTDDECMLAVPRVMGFDLQEKEWCKLNSPSIGKILCSLGSRPGQC